ncbi:MAG: Ig-like domain-containing protein [Planctomycetales bacterium]|nr:Ig-like domain-containing protein [Planctomycetales bacterium]
MLARHNRQAKRQFAIEQFEPRTVLAASFLNTTFVLGDLDHNGQLQAADLDQMGAAIRSGSTSRDFDFNGDKSVDNVDRQRLIESVFGTHVGDSNLDGEFGTTDLVQVFQLGQYEDELEHNSSWASGDWDGDGEFGTSDLVYAFQRGGFEAGRRIRTRITRLSPAHGDEMVSVARSIQVDFSRAIDPVTVNSQTLLVFADGQLIQGNVRVASTNRSATFVPDQPLPASSLVQVHIDGNSILAADGVLLDANGDGQPAGVSISSFRTLPLTRIPNTNVFGFVRDSYTGKPIVGATIRVDAFPEANVTTDETGRFELTNMPAPEFFVHIDGSTASGLPDGFVYPSVGKPFHSLPGQTVQLEMDGATFDVYLPRMATNDVIELSPTQDTTVGFGDYGLTQVADILPNVSTDVWQRAKVTIPAGAAVDFDGNAATQAAIIPVPPDQIPAPLPPWIDTPLVISVQAFGARQFDQPAPLEFPNLQGLLPGQKSVIMSFDHDAGIWVNIGTGTVTADGLTIVSDPGVGIRAPGWHTPLPGSPTTCTPTWQEDGNVDEENICANEPVQVTGPYAEPAGVRGFGSDPRIHQRIVFPDLPAGFEIAGVTNRDGGYSMVLPPNTAYEFYRYLASANSWAIYRGVTADSGVPTVFGEAAEVGVGGLDTDGDGLPDVGERAIGTNPTSRDSDGDGVSDSAEISSGLDPLDDRGFPTGIIASLPVSTQASGLHLESWSNNGEQMLAFVATGADGLSIVDVSMPPQPVVVSRINLPGNALDVAVDRDLQIAAIATGATGLAFVDLSNVREPSIVSVVGRDISHVQVADGLVYATEGNVLRRYDLDTQEHLDSIELPSQVTDLARQGNTLFVMDVQNLLQAIDIGSTRMTVTGSLPMQDGGGSIAVSDNIAYVAAISNRGSVATVNVTNRAQLSLISNSDIEAPFIAPATDVANNGSGLGLLVGSPNGESQLLLLNLKDPTRTDQLLSRIDLPVDPTAIEIAAGFAYVVDSSGGLQVINYLPIDSLGTAPTAQINAGTLDVAPQTPGIQITEGSLIRIDSQLRDDVQLRDVELLVNGVAVQRDVSPPFALSAFAPSRENGTANQVTLQLRARDTGGNVGLSQLITADLVPDTIAPVLEEVYPADGTVKGPSFDRVRLSFSESTVFAGRAADAVRLVRIDQAQPNVEPTTVRWSHLGKIVELVYPTLPLGTYRLEINQQQLRDVAGNPVGASIRTSEFRTADFTATWINSAGGDWSEPTNWSIGRVPGADDEVLVDLPEGVAVIVSQGEHTIGRLTVNGELQFAGGELDVREDSEISHLTLNGGLLTGPADIEVKDTFIWNNDTTIAGSGQIVLAAGSQTTLTYGRLSRTLVNRGDVTWNDGWLAMQDGSVRNEGTWATSPGDVVNYVWTSAGSGEWLNAGTLAVQGRTVNFSDVTLTNTGAIEIANGRLDVYADADQQGAITLDATSSYAAMSGTQEFRLNATVQGGRFEVSTENVVWRENATLSVASLAISSGKLTYNRPLTVPVLELTGGTLTGSSDITVTQSLDWSNDGTLAGSGRTILSAGSQTTLTYGRLNRTLINRGAVTWHDGWLTMQDGIVHNEGTWSTAPGDVVNYVWISAGTGKWFNQGTLQVHEHTVNFSGTTLDNSGTIDISSGRLEVYADANHRGMITLDDTSSYAAFSGDQGFLQGATIQGGRFEVSGDNVTWRDNASLSVGVLVMNGGTLTYDRPLNVPVLVLAGGTLTGSNDITVTQSLDWNNDALIAGSGRMILAAGTSGTLGFGRLSRELINRGTLTWNDGWLTLADGIVRNEGTWATTPGDGVNYVWTSTGTGEWLNAGNLQINGRHVAFSDVALTNTGTVDIRNGSLESTTLLVNQGWLALDATSRLLATNNLLLRPSSVLVVTLTGTEPELYSSIQVGNLADLAGTFRITTDAGFSPLAGNEFLLLQFALATGSLQVESTDGLVYQLIQAGDGLRARRV